MFLGTSPRGFSRTDFFSTLSAFQYEIKVNKMFLKWLGSWSEKRMEKYPPQNQKPAGIKNKNKTRNKQANKKNS